MTDARHEAPAEGAGEAAIAKLFDAVEMADDYNRLSDRPKRLAKDFLLDSELRDAVSSLRARSSAPEAREGEAARKVEWVNDASNVNDRRMYIDGQQWAKIYGWDEASLDARCDALQAAMQRTAAPSADKLRIAVEALETAREVIVGWFEAIDAEVRVEHEMHVTLKDDLSNIDQALATLKAEAKS